MKKKTKKKSAGDKKKTKSPARLSGPKNRLVMSFDPNTIEHLGVKMYSNIPTALAELIANAYDADAKRVDINLYDTAEDRRIIVKDDGVGMDFNELNSKFLRIGRKRRSEDSDTSPNGTRKVTGRKGLGKLAFFGIGNTIEIATVKANSGEKTIFILNWEQLINTKGRDYVPKFRRELVAKSEHGTTIALSDLKRKSSFDKESLAASIAKLFNLFDNDFNAFITLNDDSELQIDDKLKYQSITPQFSWTFPQFANEVNSNYAEGSNIEGTIMSTEKPLKPGLRGVTLFARGRLVNLPEFFGVSESSHGYSYMTGWLNVDFVDEWQEDVIATDRQSLNWDLN